MTRRFSHAEVIAAMQTASERLRPYFREGGQLSGMLDKSGKLDSMVEPADKKLEVHIAAQSEAEQLLHDWEWSADALDRLAQLRVTQQAIDYLIRDAVIECRTNASGPTTPDDVLDHDGTTRTTHNQHRRPVSWRKIGAALGISGQSAHQRFHWMINEPTHRYGLDDLGASSNG